MTMIIEPMKRSEAADVARLHIEGISHGFISSLGIDFVTALYEILADDSDSFALVAKEDGKILGFAAFSADIKWLYRIVIARHGIRFTWLLGRKLLSWALAAKILDAISYPFRKKVGVLPAAELLSTAIADEARGKGLATLLVQDGFKECAKRGISKLKVLVAADNLPANHLYKKCGFEYARRIRNHNILSNIYVIDLENIPGLFVQAKRDTTTAMLDELLHLYGVYVIDVDGVKWREYAGFMMPAYLPHCCPPVTAEMARTVVKISNRPFARWDTEFGRNEPSEWWYVLKKGTWDIESVPDKKKRWMIRQGQKNFTIRPLTSAEILEKCPAVAVASVNRHEIEIYEKKEMLQARLEAADRVPGTLEYIGCFSGDQLVSFAENIIQDNAVFMVYIRQNPAFLKDYSSYALVDGILEYYLNKRKFRYVLDGSRCIHHRTNFQDVLTKVFGFEKEYALLNVVYSWKFSALVYCAWPFRKMFWAIWKKWPNSVLDKVSAILRQEAIRRSCRS